MHSLYYIIPVVRDLQSPHFATKLTHHITLHPNETTIYIMDRESIEFVLRSLPKGRTLWHSFPDRYAHLILKHVVGNSDRPIADIRRSQFRALLDKPIVRTICARNGDGKLKPTDFEHLYPLAPHTFYTFRLTLDTWPDLKTKPDRANDQITRSGWNLVLQMNFPISHNRELRKRLPEDWKWSIDGSPHPIAEPDEVTLAWARIDLDLEKKEALIEEIQSDWVRDASWAGYEASDEYAPHWKSYVEEELRPIGKRWPDIILTSSLWFLIEELGIRRIFYHTHESGRLLKRIAGTPPPRSIYTQLPRRFGFRITHNGPGFIKDSANRHLRKLFIEPETQWQVIDFDRIHV